MWTLLVIYQFHPGAVGFCCERWETIVHNGEYKHICFVSFATIDPCHCVIPDNRSDVVQFNAAFQEEVTALPYDFDSRFPYLEVYNASYCSVQSISKENFDDMRRLKKLYLDNNQIETIAADTFSGLSAIIMIHLRKKLEPEWCYLLDRHSLILFCNVYNFREQSDPFHRR